MLGKTLLMAATLGVIIWLICSRRRNPLRNLGILLVMAFMVTLIPGLAFRGAAFLLSGTSGAAASASVLAILVLLVGIILLGLFGREGGWKSKPSLLIVSAFGLLLGISWLAAVGVSHLPDRLVKAAAVPWVLASLSLTVAVQIAVRVQRSKAEGGKNAPDPNEPGQGGSGGPDKL